MSRGNPVIHNTSGWGNFTKCPNFGGWAHLASVIVVGDVMQGLLAAAQVPEREPLGQTRTA